ncbi:hypothetical protein F4821DRAFT_257649 [Hypoxylon rubiginosum]|uniref:Uncharacterized protein n=1 Tax=Hypoxylon rubiginosum TaxID=110542 RepID=A0ACC0D7T8_9PEZI|nr:hypothetical protein F4821DRAFT_257649 [Hypoxylon rubiginosum]
MDDRSEIHGTGLGHANRVLVLSRGVMIGTALILPAIQREGAFYQYLIIGAFLISTLIYNDLNWRAVVRHFFLSLVGVVILILTTLPWSHISLSFLPSRIPIFVTFMSLLIEEYSRLVTLHSRPWERAPNLRQALPDANLEGIKRALVYQRSHQDELLFHTNGGEGGQYSPPSHTSSEISLTTSAPGRLPSSADTMVREFWPELERDLGARRENDEEG